MSSKNVFEAEPPKIVPLVGFIETRYVKCGRSNCHCATNKGHGPYHYLVYKYENRRYKKYIKKEDLPTISDHIEARRKQAREVAEFNRAIKRRWIIFKAQLKEFKKLHGI